MSDAAASSRLRRVTQDLTWGPNLVDVRGYAWLKDQGFNAIVDLTLEGAENVEAAVQAKLTLANIQIAAGHAPTHAQMKAFLDFVTNPAHQPCFVHCAGATGRSAVAIACFRLATQGWTFEAAGREARDNGLENTEQLDYLKDFAVALSAGKIAGYPFNVSRL